MNTWLNTLQIVLSIKSSIKEGELFAISGGNLLLLTFRQPLLQSSIQMTLETWPWHKHDTPPHFYWKKLNILINSFPHHAVYEDWCCRPPSCYSGTWLSTCAIPLTARKGSRLSFSISTVNWAFVEAHFQYPHLVPLNCHEHFIDVLGPKCRRGGMEDCLR